MKAGAISTALAIVAGLCFFVGYISGVDRVKTELAIDAPLHRVICLDTNE